MKKSLTAAALLLTLCLAAVPASGGDAGDPLVSLSYLEGSFSQTLHDAINSCADSADQEILTASRRLSGSSPNTTLKEGDVLSAPPGLAFMLLGGDVDLTVSGGAVIDVSTGREVPSGPLASGHRYITAENTSASFTVSSPTAVVSWEGGGSLALSARPDYYAIAKALRTLDLFRGSGSGIGDGFDLHLTPTRGEGLVLFIRILGEEADALACTDSHPFTDVPAWLDRYVAWAFRQGYSNGVSAATFAPDQPISAAEYMELMLRALDRSTAGVDDYSTSLERALACGALNASEYTMFKERPFLRAHAAYISYYSLGMTIGGTGQTPAQRMIANGLLTERQLARAMDQAETLRLA